MKGADGSAGGWLGVVLAGGRSRRFGRPKALEPLGGRPLAAHALDAVRAHASEVGVVGDPRVGRRLEAPCRPDGHPDRGPLEGVRTALEWAVEEGWEGAVVVACDLPLVPPALIGRLLARARADRADVRADPEAAPPDVVVPESRGPRGFEPLCAAYRASSLEGVRAALERGARSPADVLRTLRTVVLPLADVEALGDPDVFFLNVNTPHDAERAERLLSGSGAGD